MVATPDVSEYPPLPTSALPTSLGHELTVETPSDLPETRLAETQTPGTPITPEKEKEKESDYAMEGTPPTSSPVQFIGINYIPPASRERETTSPLRSSGRDPTPWESGAASPLSEDYVMIGVSTFPPKPNGQAKRGGVPVSSYRFGPARDSVFSVPPMGRIGVHHPREIVRVERDYTGGEIVQFSSVYPMELEGRITPRQFMESINAINEILISAYSLWHSVFDNCVEIFSLQLSRLVISTHYDREMKRLERRVDDLNRQLFNLAGLNLLWPRKVGFLFLEIEYY